MDRIMKNVQASVVDAQVALAAYTRSSYGHMIGDSPQMYARLIADLAHLAESNGLNLAWIMENAAQTYEAERTNQQSRTTGGESSDSPTA